MNVLNFLLSKAAVALLLLFCNIPLCAQKEIPVNGTAVRNENFDLRFTPQGLFSLKKTDDVHPTDYVREGNVFGEVTLRFREDNHLDSLETLRSKRIATAIRQGEDWQVQYKSSNSSSAIEVTETYTVTANEVLWNIDVDNTSNSPLTIADIAVSLFYNNQSGENPHEIFEERVIKHHFISGHNSFLFFQRPTGLGPYLVMTPTNDASLEYFSTAVPGLGRNEFQVFFHSAFSGKGEKRGNWRQNHTAVTLSGNENLTYGFKFQWAKDYGAIRDILIEENLIDVQVIPGMTVPNDLDAVIALRTNEVIKDVSSEYPAETRITYKGEKQEGLHLYDIRFRRLGENKLIVKYGENKETTLEFFITEPLETLYKKRAAFIVNNQQHRDSTKWYNGLFSVWDMQDKVLRGPENTDGFDKSRLVYLLASDDPVLGKAPFIAAKNVFYPDQHEIDVLEYHIENFVWGGLQRTKDETPNPYGVYGTPNWLVNRNQKKRSQNLEDPNRNKMHIWRSYDYPHIIMLYYNMYKIANMYPQMTDLGKEEYLERTVETAKAYFTYPYEILPWYETYKWGNYNELLIVDIIDLLEEQGKKDDADWLRQEWEKKVKYFLYDDPYPFRSEYAVDATAYESSHAIAKYALSTKMEPDHKLWYDKNLEKWYSHPEIKPEDAIAFMDKQIAANIASRGWLEPAYYYLGSDFRGRSDNYTLSYMSQMGGWAILDYGLNYSDNPAEYLRLGYASYLSSFALINSGTPESDFGYWYPGEENDGASGWAFEPQKFTVPWIGKPQGRGVWYYDGEIDLGFGGATRMAATVISNDPVFGLIAYGGNLVQNGDEVSVIPKDGLRRRYYYRNGKQKFDLELTRDGFSKGQPIVFDSVRNGIKFSVENRTGDVHELTFLVRGLEGPYEVFSGGKKIQDIVLREEQAEITIVFDAIPTTEIMFNPMKRK